MYAVICIQEIICLEFVFWVYESYLLLVGNMLPSFYGEAWSNLCNSC